ncbi:hypothetical protein A2210_00355 [Candidatus Woesebacteria bacterium RIFOXYA1_FULL_40_18]|uniref:Uncharacterized protein n=2 Tax=Candidatus Woeseibacteriota TaxID=1752722 RepID=A0A0G0SDG9_9BACT|nr:MAG: hypothetical protein UU03_C0020G0002 [Candidatus Woesebacteria bacterium GW2011_GWA1_40_45]OGM75535.1 MAG: hypothetical protein A2210_00355 [Candidatus Woesebacteria bacterium RIFOXYA1_FULL_40_18]
MTQEHLSINSSPEAHQEGASLMVVAKKVFAGFVTRDNGNNPLPPESLTIIKIDGAKLPLHVITNSEISIDPTSHSTWVGIAPTQVPQVSREPLTIEFGNGHFFSSLGSLSENCLSVTCGGKKGDIAVIRNGKLDTTYSVGNHAITACVVFVRMLGKMSMGDIKTWRGFVVTD